MCNTKTNVSWTRLATVVVVVVVVVMVAAAAVVVVVVVVVVVNRGRTTPTHAGGRCFCSLCARGQDAHRAPHSDTTFKITHIPVSALAP
jgi:hypothetical protein